MNVFSEALERINFLNNPLILYIFSSISFLSSISLWMYFQHLYLYASICSSIHPPVYFTSILVHPSVHLSIRSPFLLSIVYIQLSCPSHSIHFFPFIHPSYSWSLNLSIYWFLSFCPSRLVIPSFSHQCIVPFIYPSAPTICSFLSFHCSFSLGFQ